MRCNDGLSWMSSSKMMSSSRPCLLFDAGKGNTVTWSLVALPNVCVTGPLDLKAPGGAVVLVLMFKHIDNDCGSRYSRVA